MKDETYVYISDVKNRSATARSARHRRTHTGRGGHAKMPHEYLNKKERENLNGECVSYRLNEPMTWAEFKEMPDDIKVTYVKLLKEKWNVPNVHIGKMLGVREKTISEELIRLGIGRGHGGRIYWDKEAFYAWAVGAPVETKDDPVDVPADAPVDVPAPDPVEFIPVPEYTRMAPEFAVPDQGSLSFRCPANLALETVKNLLANENVEICVSWRVLGEEVENGTVY